MDDAENAVRGLTAELARFVARSHWSDIPADVGHEARRSLLNGLAAGMAGAGDRDMAVLARAMNDHAGPRRQATVIGWAERSDVLTAAFLNAARMNVYDFDDTHPTILHPTAVVAAGVLALAERRRTSGAELMLALILGVEIECRIANAVSPTHYARGWHITSTCGIFGAAAAAGRLLGLGAEQVGWAFGHAAAQASGTVETLGTLSKSVGVGQAARGGLLAALLAAEGLSGPAAPLEGQRGFLALAADRWDASQLHAGLGSQWEILRNSYKPYPCGVVLNPVIEACLELRAAARVPDAEAIADVVVAGHPLLRQRTDRPAITSGREAQVSAQHAVAVSLLTGRAGIAEFSDDAVADPAIRSLGNKVRLEDDRGLAIESAVVRLHLNGAGVEEARVEIARGSLGNPLTDAEIEGKARMLAAIGAPDCNIEALIADVWRLDRLDDVACLTAHLRPRGG